MESTKMVNLRRNIRKEEDKDVISVELIFTCHHKKCEHSFVGWRVSLCTLNNNTIYWKVFSSPPVLPPAARSNAKKLLEKHPSALLHFIVLIFLVVLRPSSSCWSSEIGGKFKRFSAPITPKARAQFGLIFSFPYFQWSWNICAIILLQQKSLSFDFWKLYSFNYWQILLIFRFTEPFVIITSFCREKWDDMIVNSTLMHIKNAVGCNRKLGNIYFSL